MIKRISLLAGLAFALAVQVVSVQAADAVGVEAVRSDAIKGAVRETEPAALPGFVPEVASNYVFATTTTGSLADMSTGTTQLLAPNTDDTASPLTPIGFEFIFQGVSFTQFSINDNGVLRLGGAAQASTPYQPLAQLAPAIITAYGADQRTHIGDGKVHYRLEGSAPTRKLIVEWLNNQANFNAGGTADLTYQVQLSETTGAIEFVYGSMTQSTAGAGDGNSNDPQIGFSSSNTAGTVGSVAAPLAGTPTFNGASATPTNNLYNAAGPITVLTSAADGSRRTMSFTPPAAIAPTSLTFTAVGPVSMTLNWIDSPNEVSYQIFRSPDGIAYTSVGTAPQNATSFVAGGLSQSTNYFWRVVAFSEGSVSTPLDGSQATGVPGNIVSTGAGGNWSNPATWAGGNVPTSGDNVTIVSGATVIIDTAAVAFGLTIDATATLTWDSVTARTLTVDTFVTNNGTFDTPATGAVTTHVLSVGSDLTNNGTLDFSTNGNTAAAGITFVGATNNTFGGTGATTDIRTLTLNKGTSNANTLELATPTFTVQGVSTDVAGFLTLTNGTFKLSGTFPLTNRVFPAAAYSIGTTAGFWLNNPNATVAAQNGSPTCSGRFRVSQGVYNIGTATGNSLGFATGANVTIEGGTINAAGRFGVSAAGATLLYTQTGGTITVATAGNTSTTLASFDMGNGAASNVNMSGGSITVQLANTAASGPRDYRHQAGAVGAPQVTGGTLTLGNASSGAIKNFSIVGVVPDLVLNTTSAAHTAVFGTAAVFNNVTRNITIGTGGTLTFGNQVFLFNGTSIVNNGTLTHIGASARFITFRVGTNITYQGTGLVTSPMTSLELQNDLNFTFDPAVSQIVVNRVIIFSGSFVNANKLTLGTGASTVAVQIGNTTTPTGGGTFDVAPAFNLGTGVQNISYLRTVNSKVVGPEVNPARALNNLSYDDDNITHSLTVAGGDLTVGATLALTNGRVITGANKITVGGTGTVTRTSGFVEGVLAKTLSAAVSRTFEVGNAFGYSPVLANVTAGTFPLVFEATAVAGPMPNFAPADKAITRHWRIAAPAATTADLTFSYLDADVPGTATEANLRVYNGTPVPPTTFTDLGGTLDTTLNTALVSAVTQFNYFSLAESGGGTAADLTITKTDGETEVDTGETLTYTIVVSNAGTNDVNAASVSETPSGALTCGAWTCAVSGAATCGAPSGTGVIADAPSLPVGTSVTYTQQCTVATVSTDTTVANTASVALPAGFIDTTPANNTATDTDTLVRLVNVGITKTNGVTTVNPGNPTTYTIVASNAGPNAAATTVSDTFPAALTGCTWTCTASSGTCAASGSGNIADSGTLQSGGTLTYTAACTVSPGAPGSLSNTATIAVGTGNRDTDPSNDSATDTDTIVPLADVAVAITDNRQFVRVGDSLNYIITVTNSGSPLSATATVSDALPSELGGGSWVCIPFGGASCASGSGNTLNDTATLPSNSQVAYVYSATVLPGSGDDVITNTVTVTSAGDPNTANNTATDTPEDIIVIFKNGFETAPVTIVPDGVGNANGFVAGRLRVDPQLLSGLGLEPVVIATGVSDRGAELFALELARFNGQVMLRSVLRDAGGLSERSVWTAVDPTRGPIEFAWQSASAEASDGYLRVADATASQISGNRTDRGRLAGLRPALQQNVPWVSLVPSGN
ncbi:hypothetical protein [Tahibacter sp.]|uniref:beta strand repeat-containing protein n=1 Tax=Tahibacter sp. TaxID=2056211 RepID=UPI0028C3A5C7|nr:hypothetical protein [Tahibacter sp.]